MTASTARKSEFPEPGDVFAQRYRIVSLVGTGGFSRVYSARQGGLERKVAIKVLAPRGAASRSSKEIVEKRFYREARLLSRLSGPNTITVHDYGRTADGLLFMVSELIDGQNLKHLLESGGPLPEARARRIFSQILLGLREVHAHGFLHRDIKPSNIMVFDEVAERDRAKLLDFGIAKGVTIGATDDTALTMAGFVIGTPGYMSPEQALGRPVTRASDLFSAGLVTYEMLTGKSPFLGMSLEQLQRRLMSEPLRLPGTVEISEDFERVLNRVLTIDAAERYETAAGALADLGIAEADYEPGEASSRPRPSNLLTFPMRLDPSGSTIVDTLSDVVSGETQTIALPSADTFEEKLPQPSGPPSTPDAADEPPEFERPRQSRTISEVEEATQPAEKASAESDGMTLIFTALAIFGVLVFVSVMFMSGHDGEKPETPDEPTPERVEVPPPDPTTEEVDPPDDTKPVEADPGRAVGAADEVLRRSVRNAELDAAIQAKEDRLAEEVEMRFDDREVREVRDHPDPGESESDTPAEEPAGREFDVTDEPVVREKPPKPEKRDFEVKPIDEM